MKIVISLLNLRPGRIGGAETYLRKLLSALAKIRGDDHITLLVSRDVAPTISAKGFQIYAVDQSARRLAVARLLEAISPYRAHFAERAFADIAPDVAFFPQQSLFPKHVCCPVVLTVHDLQHVFYPQYFSWIERLYREMIYPYSAMRAEYIIAISAHVAQSLSQSYGVPSDKITVIPHGITEQSGLDRITPYDGISSPYLYYPAATFPHKGHSLLLATFAYLRNHYKCNYKLVFTGMRTPYWRKLQKQIATLHIESDVIHMGWVSYGTVLRLFKGAEAIVFPTQYEGFGLPVYEAAQYARKIICSRLPVFDEIGVSQRLQIDFSSPTQLLTALQISNSPNLTVSPITWRQVAHRTLSVLHWASRTPILNKSSSTPRKKCFGIHRSYATSKSVVFQSQSVIKQTTPGAAKAEYEASVAARRCAHACKLFEVPRVIAADLAVGRLEFERLYDLETLGEFLADHPSDTHVLFRVGGILAYIHSHLHRYANHQPSSSSYNRAAPTVPSIHGDYTTINVQYAILRNQIVVLDWAKHPDIGSGAVCESRCADLAFFIHSLLMHQRTFLGAITRFMPRVDIFLSGYEKLLDTPIDRSILRRRLLEIFASLNRRIVRRRRYLGAVLGWVGYVIVYICTRQWLSQQGDKTHGGDGANG
jgi:glycosyltransferase involved in cell wall biosynthesis